MVKDRSHKTLYSTYLIVAHAPAPSWIVGGRFYDTCARLDNGGTRPHLRTDSSYSTCFFVLGML